MVIRKNVTIYHLWDIPNACSENRFFCFQKEPKLVFGGFNVIYKFALEYLYTMFYGSFTDEGNINFFIPQA